MTMHSKSPWFLISVPRGWSKPSAVRRTKPTGEVAIRARDIIRQICMEHEIRILSGKVSRDHVHVHISYRPNFDVSKMITQRNKKGSRSKATVNFKLTQTLDNREPPRLTGEGRSVKVVRSDD